jgi:membrane-associated phospholipid phosphatase
VIDDKAGRDEFYLSFAGNLATTHILKRTIKRERPNKADYHSMPSGHTSASFQGATFIHKRYGLLHAIVPYIGAVYVGYSRVYSKWHYKSDVYAGALLGSGFAWFFTTPYKYKDTTIEPVVYVVNDTNFYGVKIKW